MNKFTQSWGGFEYAKKQNKLARRIVQGYGLFVAFCYLYALAITL